MPTRRTQVAEALVEDIYTKTSVLQGNVQRQFIFLNEDIIKNLKSTFSKYQIWSK